MRRLGLLRRFVVIVVKPALILLTRRTWRGSEHLPAAGGVIVVANHTSHADPLVCGHFVYDAGRWPQFLAKASVFRVPVVGRILRAVRQIPVERGSVDAARSLEQAVEEIARGGCVVIYPEGTTTRDPAFWPMRGKTGVARLALATGAPVVPLAMWGAHRIFDPHTGRARVRPRMPVTVVAGPPIDLGRWVGAVPTAATLHEMTDEIMLRIRDLLAEIRQEPAPPGRETTVTEQPAEGERP